jgi:hypothetical protein
MPATQLSLGWHDIFQQLLNHGAGAAAGWMTAAPKQLLCNPRLRRTHVKASLYISSAVLTLPNHSIACKHVTATSA